MTAITKVERDKTDRRKLCLLISGSSDNQLLAPGSFLFCLNKATIRLGLYNIKKTNKKKILNMLIFFHIGLHNQF